MDVILRELNDSDQAAFFEGLRDWDGEDLSWYTFIWKEGMTYAEMQDRLRKNKMGTDLPPDRVPDTMLYGFVNGKIVGRVSIRHALNDYLKRRGGHIGYSVARPYRQKGYATQMVAQALDYCRDILQLPAVMITCADDNVPSWKIIEHFGGLLEEKVWDNEDEEVIRKYWIQLS